MAHLLSILLRHFTSSGKDDHESRPLPFLASPVDPKAYAWLHHRRLADPLVPGKVQRSHTVEQFESDQGPDSRLAGTIFRKQHEASSLELFFDLFFVANLAVFTDVHAHVDGLSVANYIGFFTILWTTWFHVAIYDVRFYTDCMVSRFFKIICFGVMTANVGLAPIYDTINDGGQTRAFTGLALMFMSFRFILAIQHAIVLYFVHGFHKTLVPLSLSIAIYTITGLAFLATYLADRRSQLTGMQGLTHVIRWYIIIVVEVLATIIVSARWRILSFRHTHLVERVGLLTLIVIGEGILGLTKSIAYDILGRNASLWAETDLIVSAVVLLYLVYVLYFHNIEHDHAEERFGSIRQQFWVLLHYFLHVAILLTVEGQTALVIWNASRRAMMWFNSQMPSIRNPAAGFNSTASFFTDVNSTVYKAASRFHYFKMTDYYDPKTNLTSLQTINSTFGTAEWNATASDILQDIKSGVGYFIFVNFQAEGPNSIYETSDNAKKVAIYNESFKVVFEYFYIGAGGLLLMLALMLWFGRVGKRKDEYCSIAVRILVGVGLPFVSLVAFLEPPNNTTEFRFMKVKWMIPIVTLSFLGVLVADNLIKAVLSLGRGHRGGKPSPAAVDEETAYTGGAATHQEKMNSVHFNGGDGRERSGSQDSGTTLRENSPRPHHKSLRESAHLPHHQAQGYAHLNQHDAVDGLEIEPESPARSHG